MLITLFLISIVLQYTLNLSSNPEDYSIETSSDEDGNASPVEPVSATSYTTSKSRLRRLQGSPTKA